MSDDELTPQSTRADILADLWIAYKTDEEFADFIEYNDLGLPLAYAVSNGIVEGNAKTNRFINETWLLLMNALDTEDTGFETLDDLLNL